MNTEFKLLVDQILHAMWRAQPVEATFMGIHRYDHLLSQTDPASRAERLEEIGVHLDRLCDFPEADLDPGELLDRRLLMDHLDTVRFTTQRLQPFSRLASTYTNEPSYGVYILQIRRFAPLKQRAESVLGRLRALPHYLKQAAANLLQGANIPLPWTETAIQEARSCMQFFRTELPQFAEGVPALKTDIGRAAKEAVEAFGVFLQFLEQELLPRSDGDFAAGQEVFDFLLAKAHGLPYRTPDLLEIGTQVLEATLRELDTTAHRIDPQAGGWEDVLAQTKRDRPPDDRVVAAYAEQMRAARDFVAAHDLVTIPPGESLEVLKTPIFQRPTIPYAAYIQPAPFEEDQTGVFWVTPVDETASPEDQEAQRRDHSVWGIPVTALHEGYPGHHLQLVHANRVPSNVRKQLGTSVFCEGWALYCEEMMYEQGFYPDLRSRLSQLSAQLWRACRVLMDVKLHTGQMTFDQAVDMLVDVARLERPNAVSEVRRYVQTPTQPMSYVIGKLQIQDLRRDYQAAAGPRFDLKAFHDKLLSYGSIPVGMIREKVLPDALQ